MASGILITYSGYPYTPSSLMPDNGLANLAGMLLKNGHDVVILDYNTVEIVSKLMTEEIRIKLSSLSPSLKEGHIDEHILIKIQNINNKLSKHKEKELYKTYIGIKDIIKLRRPNFIGFKLWMGDGFTDSIKLAEYIKRDYPNIKLYAGGPQGQLFRETIYKRTQIFDAICYGEGEEIINSLADYSLNKAELKDIPNIIYMNNGKIITNPLKRIGNLNNLAFPVYDSDIYPAFNNNGKIKIFSIDESRGCPNNCAFCVHSSISGKKNVV
jgi:Fe-S oxidoreductase